MVLVAVGLNDNVPSDLMLCDVVPGVITGAGQLTVTTQVLVVVLPQEFFTVHVTV